MSKFGWPRCILEAAVLWLVLFPTMSLANQWVKVQIGQAATIDNPWDGLNDSIAAAYILSFILMTAGVIRAVRKNILDT